LNSPLNATLFLCAALCACSSHQGGDTHTRVDTDTDVPVEDTDIPVKVPPIDLCERDGSDVYSDEAEKYIASISSETPELGVSIDESEPSPPVVGLNRFRFELSWVKHEFEDTNS
jgi:hypothetical protein